MGNDRDAKIKAQLDALLESPRFKTKSRLSWVLRYVVEAALADDHDSLTERSIAKKIFGEQIVAGEEKSSSARTAMYDLRLELTDYYFNEGCNDDVLIQLTAGSYTPKFRIRSETFQPSIIPVETETPNPHASLTSGNDQTPAIVPGSDDQMFPDPNRIRACIVFDFDKINNALAIEPALQQSCGDPTLRVLQLRLGSVMVYFECDREAYFRLISALQKNQLTPILGTRVRTIRIAELIDDEIMGYRPEALETCVTPMIDLAKSSSNKLHFVIWNREQFMGPDRFNRSAYSLISSAVGEINDVAIEINAFTSWDARTWRKTASRIFLDEAETDGNTMMLSAFIRGFQMTVEVPETDLAGVMKNPLTSRLLKEWTKDPKATSVFTAAQQKGLQPTTVLRPKVFVEFRILHRFADLEAQFNLYIWRVDTAETEITCGLKVDVTSRARGRKRDLTGKVAQPLKAEQRLDSSQRDVPFLIRDVQSSD
jgi:hypothetical protein